MIYNLFFLLLFLSGPATTEAGEGAGEGTGGVVKFVNDRAANPMQNRGQGQL
jgi:hypothetical protein